jgi:hypothetical protein
MQFLKILEISTRLDIEYHIQYHSHFWSILLFLRMNIEYDTHSQFPILNIKK